MIPWNVFLRIRKAPAVLDRPITAAIELRVSYQQAKKWQLNHNYAKYIHSETQEASQNTDLHMWEFLGIDKSLQSVQGELVNNSTTLIEIDKHLKKECKELKRVGEDDHTYYKEQRGLKARRLEDWMANKSRNLFTKSKRSSNTSCKDQTDHWKSPRPKSSFGIWRIFL